MASSKATKSRREPSPVHRIAELGLVRMRAADLRTLEFQIDEVALRSICAGEAAWLAETRDGRKVGIAFPWANIDPGGLVVADLMSISTNVLAFDEGGILSEESHRACMFSLLQSLGWQRAIAVKLQ